jgi:hypothetical protein
MDMPPQSPSSYLFTVRLWKEAVGEGRTEVRGKVQYVLSGEVRYFRDWRTLSAFLIEVVGCGEGDERADDNDEHTRSGGR